MMLELVLKQGANKIHTDYVAQISRQSCENNSLLLRINHLKLLCILLPACPKFLGHLIASQCEFC